MPLRPRRLLIHVGPPKTGTSAVQHYLRSEATPGLIYPEAGRWADGAHHNLVFNFFEDRSRPEVIAEDADVLFRQIVAECSARPGDILISAETLVDYDIKRFVDSARAHLSALVSDVELIFTYRDHFGRAASLYNQRVKDGFYLERRDPDSFLRAEMKSLLYASLQSRLSLTGCTVRMVNYHPSETFLTRFLAVCGYEPVAGIQDVRRNVSLSVPGMVAVLAANRAAETAEERHRLFDRARRLKGFFETSKFIFGQDVFAEVAPIFAFDRRLLQALFNMELPCIPDQAPENCFHIDDATLARLAEVTAPLGPPGARMLAHAYALRQSGPAQPSLSTPRQAGNSSPNRSAGSRDLALVLKRGDLSEAFSALEGQINLTILASALESLHENHEIHPIIRLVEHFKASGRLSALTDETLLMLECHHARCLLTAFVPLRAVCILEALMARADRYLTALELADLHLLLSRCQLEAGQATAATETLVRAESRWPYDSRATFAHMEVMSRRDPASALKMLRRVEANPIMASSLEQHIVLRGDILIGGGVADEAVRLALEATANDPNSFEALRAQINVQATRGDTLAWAGAMDCFLKLGSRSEIGICADVTGDVLSAFESREEPEALAVTPVSHVVVIMSVFNAACTLRHAIASVRAQTHKAFRLILVDDCSTDGSSEIMREIAVADPRIVIIENPTNLGKFRSINRAMKLVFSDFYTFHDADAWMHPERLARAMAVIEAGKGVKCVYSQWIRINRQGRVETPPLENRASSLFVREVLDDIGYFDHVSFGADLEFQWRLRQRYGAAAIVTLADVMAVDLRGFGSSIAEPELAFDAFGANPLGSAYAESFLRWHMSAGAENMLRIEFDDPLRLFPAPREMTELTPIDSAAVEDPFMAAHEAAEARGGSPIVVRWPDAPPGGRNWGDKLNPALVELLSQRPVINSQHPDRDRSAPVHYVVGSGIASAADNALVWGSGFISSDQVLKSPVERIVAVRGPLTRQRVVDAGGDPALPIGDPALLLPLFYNPDITPCYDVGLIQHFREAGAEPLPRFPSGMSVRLIDITGGLKEVVDAVLSCRRVLSSSLHGLIVSHAYGVPATWLKFSDRPLGDDFKFHDYWASIGRSSTDPIDVRGGKIVDPIAGVSTPGDVLIDLFALLGACPFISEERRLSLVKTARAGAREGTKRTILTWHAGLVTDIAEDDHMHLVELARRHTWCVFTSAGDYNNVAQWRPALEGANWDLITAFYGDSDEEYNALNRISSSCVRLKGSKFQNLKQIHDTNPRLFEGYTHIWVCDDDIQMSPDQIVRAFTLTEQLGVWAAQPAFSALGKAPHRITVSQYPDCDARLTTFIEVTCPLFRADRLFDFLSVYDPFLMGWGIDWWFCHHLRSSQHWRMAILDCVEVTNPLPDQRRGGRREILRLATNEEREAQWRAVQKAHNIPEVEHRTLARLTLSAAPVRKP